MQPNINPNQNRPMNPQPQMDSGSGVHVNQVPMQASGSSKLPWIILVVVVVVVLGVLGFLFRDKFSKSNNAYQAVFLTNGQVYFGKLSHADGQYVWLSDIYYLQVNQQLQSGANGQQAQQQQTQPQLSLVKLGNELHGPTDTMFINRTQILFFEDLKNDGKVVQAIQQYKANPNAAAQQPQPQQQVQQQQAPAQQPQQQGQPTGQVPPK